MNRASIALTAAIIFVGAAVQGQQDLETARQVIVHGAVEDGSTNAVLRLSPLDASPSKAMEYEVPVVDGFFSKEISLFPGANQIEILSNSSSMSFQTFVEVRAPRLRVELSWPGGKQDYDLYVNGVFFQTPNAEGGVLDRDARVPADASSAVENITFASASGGLYRVYVNYYADNNSDDSGAAHGQPQPTTVKVLVDEKLVYQATQTISSANASADLGGNGGSVWNVGTLVLHSGHASGGFTVGASGYREIIPQKTFLPDWISPRTDYAIDALEGSAGGDEVFLPVGSSSLLTASGRLNLNSGNEQFDAKIIEKFSVADPSIAFVDPLGVVTGIVPGRTTLGASGSSSAIPISVVGEQFEAVFPFSALDELSQERWLMVPMDGVSVVLGTTVPNTAFPAVKYFVSPDATGASVNPGDSTFPSQRLSVSGLIPGSGSTLEARMHDGNGPVLGSVHLTVKRKMTIQIALHAITDQKTMVDPPNVPTKEEAEEYLNRVYGTQANIFFSVIVCDSKIVDYDLDRIPNGLDLSAPMTKSPGEFSAEEGLVSAAALTTGVLNVFYVRKVNVSDDVTGFTRRERNLAYVLTDQASSALWTTAHEVGHILGLEHADYRLILPKRTPENPTPPSYPNPGWVKGDHTMQIMYHAGNFQNYGLVKGEWDYLNHDN